MKIKKGFMLRQVADSYVVVATGTATAQFNGVVTLNQTGALLWEQLVQGCEPEELTDLLKNRYGISENKAKEDADAFVEKVVSAELTDEN